MQGIFFFVKNKIKTFWYLSVVKRCVDTFLLQYLVNIDCCVKETAIYKASISLFSVELFHGFLVNLMTNSVPCEILPCENTDLSPDFTVLFLADHKSGEHLKHTEKEHCFMKRAFSCPTFLNWGEASL